MQRWQFILLAVVLAWLLPVSAHAHARPSQAAYDVEPPVEIVVFVAGITMDTDQGHNEDPLSLHKYAYAETDPENNADPLGLDIWVIRDASGLIRHRIAIGNNANGTYWSSDFDPTSHNMILRASCQGVINFYKVSAFDPKKLSSDYVFERHIIADQSVTDKTRDYAKMRSEQSKQPWYDAFGYNCIDWAEGLARYAMGANIREKLDKN